jgi:four helix bundle suffix protein
MRAAEQKLSLPRQASSGGSHDYPAIAPERADSGARCERGTFFPGDQSVVNEKPLKFFIAILSGYALTGGMITLLGWLADWPALTDWIGSGIAMFANTALASALGGLALLLGLTRKSWNSTAAQALGYAVALIGGATLLEHIFHVDFHIDRLLVNPLWGQRAAVSAGRMGPPASSSLTLLGIGIVLAASRLRARRIVPALALLVLATSSIAITGYAFRAAPLFSAAKISGIALQTATILFALALSLLASVPDLEPAATLREKRAAGLLIRRALPLITVLPLILGWLFVIGRGNAWFDRGLGTALLVLALTAVLWMLLWRSAKDLAKYEKASIQSEAELRRKTGQLAAFLETAALGLHRVGPDGIILWANKAEMEMLGYAPDEYIGRPITDFHADEPVINDILKRLSCGEKLCEREARLRCKNGSIKEVLIDSSVLRENGQFIHTQCFTRDISARKRAERRLAVEYAISDILVQFRSVDAATPAILEAISKNANWSVGVLWLVDKQENALRCVKIWRSAAITAPEFASASANRLFPKGVGLPGAVWAKGEPIWIARLDEDENFPRASFASKEKLQSAVAFPIRTDAEVLGVFEFFSVEIRNVDEEFIKMLGSTGSQIGQFIQRKRAEENAAQLAAIVEQSDDAIISKDLNGTIQSWNKGAEKLFGYTALEVLGGPANILIPAGRMEEEPDILERVRRGESLDHYETVRHRKDGTLLEVSLTVSPVRDAQGKVIGASTIARDITDRVRAKEKLEQIVAERTAKLRETVAELEAYSYSIAHDMRSPLRSMSSFSRILEEDFGALLPPEGNDFLRRISASAVRMDALITDILNYSRISRSELKLESVDVEKLAREIIDSYPDFRDFHHFHDAAIRVEGPIPFVVGNAAALTQCISNLLSNALKFIVKGTAPRVRIFAETKPGRVRLWFEDNGIGIPPGERERIFTMFQRLHSSEEFEGNGIGLTIVRRCVERMGGQAGVESEPGVGSRLGRKAPQAYELYREFVETRPPEVVANIALCLVHQTNYLLDQQIRRLQLDFLKDGGIRERMTRVRLAHRNGFSQP